MTDDDQLVQAAVTRARRHLALVAGRTPWEHNIAARAAVRIFTAATATRPADDPPIAASLQTPSWNGDTGPYPVVPASRSLLGLLEEAG